MKKISQAQARFYRKELAATLATLTKLKQAWYHDYPGIHLGSISPGDQAMTKAMTARKLGFVMVAVANGSSLELYAVAT